jgi:hypothetical protein
MNSEGCSGVYIREGGKEEKLVTTDAVPLSSLDFFCEWVSGICRGCRGSGPNCAESCTKIFFVSSKSLAAI